MYPRIDEEIKARGTVAQFLRTADINIQTYYAMQKGRTTPSLGIVYKILRYTGMTFEEAFGSELLEHGAPAAQDREGR